MGRYQRIFNALEGVGGLGRGRRMAIGLFNVLEEVVVRRTYTSIFSFGIAV